MLTREHVRLRHSGSIQEYRKKFGEITYTKLTYHRYHRLLFDSGCVGKGSVHLFENKSNFSDGQNYREIYLQNPGI